MRFIQDDLGFYKLLNQVHLLIEVLEKKSISKYELLKRKTISNNFEKTE